MKPVQRLQPFAQVFLLAAPDDQYEKIRSAEEILDAGVDNIEFEDHRVNANIPFLASRQRARKLRSPDEISAGRVRPYVTSLNGALRSAAQK